MTMQEVFRLQQATAAESLTQSDIVEQARSLRQRTDSAQRGLALTIRGLRKSFGEHEVLRGIDVHIPAGQFVMGSPATEPDRSADETAHQQVRIDLNAKQAITFFADHLGSNLSLECSADAKSLSVRQTSISLTQ